MSALAKVRQIPKPARKEYRIALRPGRLGELDDVVVCNVKMFRMERMSNNYWWLACYFDNGDEDLVFGISAKRAEVRAYVESFPRGPEFTYEPGSIGEAS